MTDREKMLQIIYKAVADGLSKLIKNGLAFTVMLGAIGGLAWGIFFIDGRANQNIAELKAEIKEMKADHSRQLNELRIEIINCDQENTKLRVRVAELEMQNKYNKH